MILKLIAVASMLSVVLPLNATASPSVEVADDEGEGEGDLNPQPLPPISEEESAQEAFA